MRLYWPVELRPAFDALFGLDDALADVVAKARQPVLGAIKLAWWRERLEDLGQGTPAEPRLRAVESYLLPRGISGALLAPLTDGWETLLEETPDKLRIGLGGARLFAIGAALLDTSDEFIGLAGSLYRHATAARRNLSYVEWTIDPRLSDHRFAKALRPLTALAALAARDARRSPTEPEATPGRSWTLIRHRLTGRI